MRNRKLEAAWSIAIWALPDLSHLPDSTIHLSLKFILRNSGLHETYLPIFSAEFKRRKRYRVKAVEYKLKGLIQ